MGKVNYQLEMERQLAGLTTAGQPLLLHSCCGPCSTAVLERLAEHFTVTILYYNPNIYPPEEYRRRMENQETVVDRMTTRFPVSLMPAPYVPRRFAEAAAGLEDEPEGGARCTRCFALRLEATARLARERDFPYFTTTLSVSPHKDVERINGIGRTMGEQYGVTWLFADFKKKDGYRRSVQLADELGLYRQNYCGCQFSLAAGRESF